ncbi:hypothetical protein [Bradyrhizobium sp. LM2.9]
MLYGIEERAGKPTVACIRQNEGDLRLEGVQRAGAVEDFRDEIIVLAEELFALDPTNGQEMCNQFVQRIQVVATDQGEAEFWLDTFDRR